MQLSHHLVLASSSIATCVIRPHEASWWACCFSDCETSTRAQLASGSRPDVVEPHETLFQQLTPFHPGDRAGPTTGVPLEADGSGLLLTQLADRLFELPGTSCLRFV